MKLDKDRLTSLPKVLLHEHLDGVLRPQTVIDLAKETKYTELPTSDPVALAQWFHQGANKGSLAKYLEGFAHTIAVMPVPHHGLGEAINDRLRRAAVPTSS